MSINNNDDPAASAAGIPFLILEALKNDYCTCYYIRGGYPEKIPPKIRKGSRRDRVKKGGVYMLKIPRFMSEYASYILREARNVSDHTKKSLIETCTRRALQRYETGLQSINETMQVLCNIGRSL